MPNGFHGPVEEWDQIELPLRKIDSRLARFADEHKMRVGKNHHSWPERSLFWKTARVDKSIQIFLKDEKEPTYCLCVIASEDRDQSRYWKKEMLVDGADWNVIERELESLLTRARELADRWTAKDLEFAGNLTMPK